VRSEEAVKALSDKEAALEQLNLTCKMRLDSVDDKLRRKEALLDGLNQSCKVRSEEAVKALSDKEAALEQLNLTCKMRLDSVDDKLRRKEALLDALRMAYEEHKLLATKHLEEHQRLLNESSSEVERLQEENLRLSRPGQDDKIEGVLISMLVAFSSGFGLQSFATHPRQGLKNGCTRAVVIVCLARWVLSGGDWVPLLCGTTASFLQLVFYVFIRVLHLDSSTIGFVAGLVVALPLCFFGIEELAKASAPLMALACGFFGGASMRSHDTGHPEPLFVALGGAIGFGTTVVYFGIDYPAEVSFFIFSGGVGMTASTAWFGSRFCWQQDLQLHLAKKRSLEW